MTDHPIADSPFGPADIRSDGARPVSLRCALPICDLCEKPVDRLTEQVDEFCGRVVYTAECHGQRERVDVELGAFSKPGADSLVQFGRAFLKRKELSAASQEEP